MIHLKLKQLRKQKGLSQNDMAEALHKSQNAYSMIESGQSKLDAQLIPEICRIFEIDPSDLFDYKDITVAGNEIDLIEILKILKEELDQKNYIIQSLINIHFMNTEMEEKSKSLQQLLNIIVRTRTENA